MEAADHTNTLPIGRKIEKVRRLRSMTQTDLGDLLGVSKQAISKMEQAKQIDPEKINEIAKVLSVTADVIHNYNEEATFNIISNNDHDYTSSVNYQFNPIEKIIELCQEKIALYERMIKEKDQLIDKLMNQKI